MENNNKEMFNEFSKAGIGLLVERALPKSLSILTSHIERIKIAIERDLSRLGIDDSLLPLTHRHYKDLERSVKNISNELRAMEDYYQATRLDGHITTESVGECCGNCGCLTPEDEAQLTAAPDLGGANQAEMEASLREAEGRTYIIDGPGPDFDPALLRAKRVSKINIKRDVRTKTTLGNPNVEFVEGSKLPVVWLEAADGTRVTLHRDDFQGLRTVLEQMS